MDSLKEIGYFVGQRRPEGIILDTNVLVLLLIGTYDPSFIEKCGITSNQSYDCTDYDLLKKIIAYFKKIVITPQVIAELSNLSTSSRSKMYGKDLHKYFGVVLHFLETAEENHLKISELLDKEVKIVSTFGLTDLTMLQISRDTNMPILTDDAPFYAYAISQRAPMIQFQHIKAFERGYLPSQSS